jgi:single-strand DNA-binding protein
MAGISKITLVGNLGRDPEVKYSQGSNMAMADFSIAVSNKKKDRDGRWNDHTEWFSVRCFGRTAENYVAKYLKKGQRAYVEGRLEIDRWVNRDGKDQVTLKVIANDVQGLGGGGESRDYNQGGDSSGNSGGGFTQNNNAQQPAAQMNTNDDYLDDVPF